MIDRNQLREIQERMEQEHQKDREALERLMRFIPETVMGEERGPKIVPAGTSAIKQQSKAADPLNDLDHVCLDAMREKRERDWTIRDLISEVESRGVKLPSHRPEAVLNRSMRRLVAHQKVSVILEPLGRRAGVYKFKADVDEQRIAS